MMREYGGRVQRPLPGVLRQEPGVSSEELAPRSFYSNSQLTGQPAGLDMAGSDFHHLFSPSRQARLICGTALAN